MLVLCTNLKKMERYLRVNLLGPGPRLIKKNLPGRGITMVEKHWIRLRALFIIPTDVHNYKIIGMLKTTKIPTIAPTCFGSRRSHHQGAISCLAKTIIMILCARR